MINRGLRSLLLGLLVFGAIRALAGEQYNVLLAPHAGDLVVVKGEQFAPFESAEFLRAPYTILYFGAGWCPDCRRFSPALVKAYGGQSPGGKRFEVLFLTMDKNEEGMLKYMRGEGMTWPAVAFHKMAAAQDLKKFYSGNGIPCLTIIDRRGRILLQSSSDQDAAQLLEQFQELLRKQN